MKGKKKAREPKYNIKRDLVQFVGLNGLDKGDQKRIKEVLYQHVVEIEREIKTINKVRIHFKEYEKGGRKKYSVQLLIDSPTKPITVNHTALKIQWDPVAIIHKLIEKAKRQIDHKLKAKKKYTPRKMTEL
jgi:hypothetical protein